MNGHKLARARAISAAELAQAGRAYLLLGRVRILLAWRGLEATRMWSVPKGRARRGASDRGTRGDRIEPEAIARAVDRAARSQPGATCLPRAIVLERLLAAEGWPAQFNIGARRTGEGLEGHAWVTLDGRTIGERPGTVERYTPFLEASSGPGGSAMQNRSPSANPERWVR